MRNAVTVVMSVLFLSLIGCDAQDPGTADDVAAQTSAVTAADPDPTDPDLRLARTVCEAWCDIHSAVCMGECDRNHEADYCYANCDPDICRGQCSTQYPGMMGIAAPNELEADMQVNNPAACCRFAYGMCHGIAVRWGRAYGSEQGTYQEVNCLVDLSNCLLLGNPSGPCETI